MSVHANRIGAERYSPPPASTLSSPNGRVCVSLFVEIIAELEEMPSPSGQVFARTRNSEALATWSDGARCQLRQLIEGAVPVLALLLAELRHERSRREGGL